MCPKPNDTQIELEKTSYVEELGDGVPGLFAALTSDPDPQERWLSITYPVDIDLSAYRPTPERHIYHLRKTFYFDKISIQPLFILSWVARDSGNNDHI